MKLFHQLSPQLQEAAIRHASSIVIEDMLRDEVVIEAIDGDNVELFEKVEKALKHIKNIDDEEKKVAYLMSDPDVSQAIVDLGLEFARAAFYMEPDEIVIFTEVLEEESEEEFEQEIEINTKPKGKKKAALN